jgi:hypothetical protein
MTTQQIEQEKEMSNVTYQQKSFKNLPLEVLVESELNSDRNITAEMIAAMIIDLTFATGTATVITPFIVTPADENGRHGVIDGKTRLKAMEQIKSDGGAYTDSTPCIVLTQKQMDTPGYVDSLIQSLSVSNNRMKAHERAYGIYRLIEGFALQVLQVKSVSEVDTNSEAWIKAFKKGKGVYKARMQGETGSTKNKVDFMTLDRMIEYVTVIPDMLKNSTVEGVTAGLAATSKVWRKWNEAVEKHPQYAGTLEEFMKSCQEIVGKTNKAGAIVESSTQKPITEDSAEDAYKLIAGRAALVAKEAKEADDKATRLSELSETASVVFSGNIPAEIEQAIQAETISVAGLELLNEKAVESNLTPNEIVAATVISAHHEADDNNSIIIDDRALKRTAKETAAKVKADQKAKQLEESDLKHVSNAELLIQVKEFIGLWSSSAYHQSYDALDRTGLEAMFTATKQFESKIGKAVEASAKRLKAIADAAETEANSKAAS